MVKFANNALAPKNLHLKLTCYYYHNINISWILVGQQWPSSVPSVAGTVTPELIFTATTDAVQWVQIYGLSRLTHANEFRPE